ncbi:MAG: SPFH domain-containing protein [candidate division Zixibacteria bacterium]|nr:SPFH domain-containing protein [candidate division Zixibacteria bacterium]MDH3935789.1 SPFH domain-containing protein [candidate division Zixibacteria bacterium]
MQEVNIPNLSNLPIARIIRFVAIGAGVILAIWIVYTLFGKNDAGYYQVRQDIITGELSVKRDFGIYYNGLKKVTTYQIESSYTFSNDRSDENVIGEAIEVRFNDGGIGRISGDFRFRLPANDEDMLRLHQEFGTGRELMNELYIQGVKQSVYNTSLLMSSEESYTNKSLFPQWTLDQLQAGVYKTEEYLVDMVDEITKEIETRKAVRIHRDEHGNPIRNEPVLNHYGITISQATIREPEYDKNILGLIREKRSFEVAITIAEADAEKASQEKLTVIQDGKKRVTEAEYSARKVMQKAIEEARKDKTVALTVATKGLIVAEQDFLAEKSKADGLIAQARGEADKRKKIKEADNALVMRTEAFEVVMGYYKNAFTKISWSPRIATSGAAYGENGLPSALESYLKIAEVVRKDLNLDLTF